MLGKYLMRQFARPSGWIAPWVGRSLNRGNRRLNRAAIEALDLKPGDRLIEVGFGGGGALAEISRTAKSVQLCGIDVSEPMIEQARLQFHSLIEADKMDVRQSAVDSIPWPDGTFDRALAVNTINYWKSPIGGLHEILRVLKPGGRVVVATRSKAALDKARLRSCGYAVFSDDEAEALMVSAGFREVRVVNFQDFPHGDAILIIGQKATAG